MDVTRKREIIEQFVGDLNSPRSVRTDSGEVEQHDLAARRKAIDWALEKMDELDAEESGRKRGLIVGQIRNVDHF